MPWADDYLSPNVVASTFAVLFLCYIVSVWAEHASIPGPFLASLTNFVRLYWTWQNHPFDKYIELHRRYGRLVRIGPNVVSVSDPAEISTIYGFNYKFEKSDFYRVNLPYANGKPMVGTISPMAPELHKKLKAPATRIFTTSNMLQFEEFVDNSIALLLQRIEDLFIGGKACNVAFWFGLFVYDTMGEMTFSKKYGHLEAGSDVGNIIADVDWHFQSTSLVGQVPWYDLRLKITPLKSRLLKQPDSPLVVFQMQRTMERQALLQQGKAPSALVDRDMLSQFLRVEAADPTLPPGHKSTSMMWIATNIGAGSGTTASTLTAMLHYIAGDPSVHRKLTAELRSTKLSEPPTWPECQALTYLDSCVRETERLHPAIGMHLERVVPPEGATICGKFLKGGTVVGMNPWVVNRDKNVFGEDSDTWRPERWLEDPDRRRHMQNTVLTYGAGTRACYGIAVARLIMFKTAASIFTNFRVTLVDKEAWRSEGRWFTTQANALIKFERL